MEVFDRSYLKQVVEVQGALFDAFAREHPASDTDDFIVSYMKSRTRAAIDVGHAYVCTMYDADLMRYFLTTDGYQEKQGEQMTGFMPDWIGRFYALYQWTNRVSSVQTLANVPLDYLKVAYRGLHDLELDLAVAKVAEGMKP